MPFVLILEDDLTYSVMLSTWLKRKRFEVETTSTVAGAKSKIKQTVFDVILSDFRLPDGTGMDLLTRIKEEKLSMPVIMMTSYADIPTAVQAIKSGASDYIAKPVNPEELLKKINDIIQTPAAPKPKQQAQQPAENGYLEGQSSAAKQLYEHVKLVAGTEMSVLITGASGTGKEYIAQRIHQLSNRRKAPFVAVDCGAIPKDLAASEFFGHVKGSFTGAIEDKTGAFVAGNGGTIFLDEIGNLSYKIQVQLLRAIQERKIKPVGSNREITIDVRLISATNEDLHQAIDNKSFREDLYHRINEFSIHVPDLKNRTEDILLFANHFLDAANKELQKDIVGFDAETTRLFLSYSWPGNLRQMKNTIRYATLLTSERYITLNDLPKELTEYKETPQPVVSPLKDETGERILITRALQEAGNNKSKAARLLGIDRKTLYNKLKFFKID
ncbi:MAG: sigma-54 dependent transcriptional regulator [Candidatus Azobacteroides sp.]|nr:sigma-54 dependent transcriptional regulator [Candidatus Azobacteroides sp.]